jgi:uncharacterized protein (DUF58 family)
VTDLPIPPAVGTPGVYPAPLRVPERGTEELGVRRIRWRPTGQWGLFLGIAFVAIGTFTGNGAQVGLGLALAAVVVTDRVIAGRTLADVGVRFALPPVSVAGDDVGMLVSFRGGSRPVRVDLMDPWRGIAGSADPGDDGVLPVAGPPRGLIPAVTAQLWSAGPLGMVEVSRRVRWWLDAPAAVGPRDRVVASPWPEPTGALMGLDARSPRGQELTRGVRDYRPGDPRKRVHWKATARTGHLMVRETEGEAVGVLTVAVSLAAPGPAAEEAVSRARWYAEEGLRRGWVVHLVTAEDSVPPGATIPPVDHIWTGAPMVPGPTGWLEARGLAVPSRVVDGRVATSVDVLRRLAAAVPGEVPAPRRPGAVRRVTDGGDSWA